MKKYLTVCIILSSMCISGSDAQQWAAGISPNSAVANLRNAYPEAFELASVDAHYLNGNYTLYNSFENDTTDKVVNNYPAIVPRGRASDTLLAFARNYTPNNYELSMPSGPNTVISRSASTLAIVQGFTVRPNGNVGIGTINPQSLLDVNGLIHTKEVKVDSVGWADYVFDDNYKLRPLSEVKDYILINKRLPDVPSAEEVKANGLLLGQTNALLLKKIEELTLYGIRQDSLLKKTSGQLEELEKRYDTQKSEMAELQAEMRKLETKINDAEHK
ncbi:hypothetical protein A9P82_08345 [Arachidicoccus ginsenosidimutans]|uniref:hypothetical protein n=1 Tax=Arachidicoccus sp. BS20 TaxID=1850526 RepID=UPI0007F0799B|nr:hypothetical protein [Arachidicoccus sp. BS20]ANI89299.1 hypothetical protein A9P82_08345 [Arachidicoccus sp. BS20]